MSWWVSLNDPITESPVEVPRFVEGGSYVLGGSTEADLNVTYNYGKHFDFKVLDSKKAEDTASLLLKTVKQLGVIRETDYWEPTRGNVGFAVSILLAWALANPKAIFTVR